MKKTACFVIAISSSIISFCVYADSDNYCGNFHIQIANLSQDACILTSQKVIHGNLITPPPLSILPHDSKRFDMMQSTTWGPSITLSYQCGAEIITFNSQQNFCFFSSGKIKGIIIEPAPAYLNAKYMPIAGSYYWDRPGSINWTIVDLPG